MLELTGHTILNAKVAWEELANFANNGKAEKLYQSWLPKDPDNGNGSIHQQLSSASPTARSGVLN